MKRPARAWFVALPLLCALFPLVCVPGAEWLAVAPDGSESWLWLNGLFALIGLAAVLLALLSVLGIAFDRTRRWAALLMLCSASYLGAIYLAVGLGSEVRTKAFHRLAERSKPLVQAIHAYEAKYGHPPASLQTLVPEFISAVPSTGMGAYPGYKYTVITDPSDQFGNPWMLSVYTPSGGINWDSFMYLPFKNYPERGYGGWLERIGDWAYVHE